MVKLMFKPVAILSGILAGLLARRSFASIWRRLDERDPPASDQRSASLPKLALSLSIQGAVFSLARGLLDNLSRRGFAGLVGRWPGNDDGSPSAG